MSSGAKVGALAVAAVLAVFFGMKRLLRKS
jgi:hypothetical protein